MNVNEIQVWVGCLGCYNAGRLSGDWVAAIDAAGVKPSDLEHAAECMGSEELWVFDTELPRVVGGGEMSPVEATRIAEALVEAEAELDFWLLDLSVFLEWLDETNMTASDFLADPVGLAATAGENWQGDDWDGYVSEYIDSLGVPEALRPYIDVKAVARDMAHYYFVTASGNVFNA